jgi:tRNA(fMet)-specific endonuclease VapC
MTDYTMDSDIFSLFEGKHPQVVARVFATPPDQLTITAITVRERLDGWYGLLGRVKTPEQEAALYQRLTDTVRICSTMRVLPYTATAIERFKQLQAMKLNVRPMDLRIAAIALEYGVTLVTRNTRDFVRIPGLIIEDWTQI